MKKAALHQISRKYDVSSGNVIAWEKKYMNKCVSLPTDIIDASKPPYKEKSLNLYFYKGKL